ncbi:peptidase S41 [Erythrobacter arachoides]|uniref:Peptidase S41 n=1 Tax=Aurantiacibacter arachoides TaxID=1850444 RepID=A0A845A2Q7_9SPHN|nr:S41 family peptidase [Aurantiacibacter arachoides]MXO93984.1 peptidase S41 [Aurantiacibacter arachoides]GGD45030.1 peptidase S41 [Aurantiacibacter arachoides]
MRTSKFSASLAVIALLAGCGGGGGSNNNTGGVPSPSPTPTTAQCSLSAQQDFVRNTLNTNYLFPELLDLNVNKANYSNLQSYIDALVAPARAQAKDRFFTYATSIAEETAFQQSGASAGFGFRLRYDSDARRLFVIETFEGTSALGANVDRGTEIVGIGTSAANIVSVSSLFANGGAAAVSDALGPSTAGTTRVLRVIDQTGATREVSLSKTDYSLDPVSDRYGARIINDGGKQVGYINLRTFSVASAEQDLNTAFGQFRAAGVTELIIDVRYNGGGLIRIAERFADLLGRNLSGQVFERIAFRPSRSGDNSVYNFNPNGNSIAPTKIAFITSRSTASASELIINGIKPYVQDIALIGDNTFGKPVGQEAFDLAACDLRFRAVTLEIRNRDNFGDYYTGLAASVPKTCRAADTLNAQLGDPNESQIKVALDFLAGRSCTPISASTGAASVRDTGLLLPTVGDRTPTQHEVPGAY